MPRLMRLHPPRYARGRRSVRSDMGEVISFSGEENVDTKLPIVHNISASRLRISTFCLDGAFKRAFDIFASAFGLLLLSPLFLYLAWRIKQHDPGPVFYRGPRMGKNGKVFHILKFRTMYERPESYRGARITAHDDERITPLGRWLRETKLNELPQLWNVLKGEMSLVGPRPEDPTIAASWPEDARRVLLSVRPGITSPASVIYHDEEALLKSNNLMDKYLWDILPDKLRMDQLYVRKRSFLTDLDVIFWTLIVLIPRLREVPVSRDALYNGPLYRFFRGHFSWFLADWLVAFGTVAIAGALWRTSAPLDLGIGVAMGVAAGLALCFGLVNGLLGLGRISWRHASANHAFDLAFSSGLTTLLLALVDGLWPGGPFLPLGIIFVAGLIAFLGFLSMRYRERLITGLATRWLQRRGLQGELRERALIVGAGECGLLAAWLLRKGNFATAFSVIGMVDDDPLKQGLTLDGIPVLGTTSKIPQVVSERGVSLILFAIENISSQEQARILNLCEQAAARVVIVPDLLGFLRERLSPKVSIA